MMDTFKMRKNRHITLLHIPFTVLLVSSIFSFVSNSLQTLAFGAEGELHSAFDHSEGVHPSDSRWSYHGFQGPLFWGFLEDEYKACRLGHQQSPIDVVMPNPPDHQEELTFDYGEMLFEAIATKHGIQFQISGNSRLLISRRNYHLKQFHFHDPSEHHIHGKEFPLEMHFVHEDQSGHLLVVALLFTEGEPNGPLAVILKPELQPHESQPVHYGNRSLETFKLNVRDFFPENHHHFSYLGSLTTPPCTQGVQWIIMRTPLQLSSSQLVRLKTLYDVNARPVQPLYNREVYGY